MVGGYSMHSMAIPIDSKGSGLDHLITSIPLTRLIMQPAIQISSNEVEVSS